MGRRTGRVVAAGVLAIAVLPVGLEAASATGAPPASGDVAPSVARVPSGGCARPFLDSRVRCLFDATGAPESWTVPAGVSMLVVDAWGAQGASLAPTHRSAVAGGRGAGIYATIDVRVAETLTIAVGARGVTSGMNLRRQPARGSGGTTTVGDTQGPLIVAAGGGAPMSVMAGQGVVAAAPGAAGWWAVRPDLPALALNVDPLGKVNDGQVRVVYDQPDPDGAPSVVVRLVPATSSAPVRFAAVFSEPVSGFAAEDVQLGGDTTAALRATVRPVAPLDGAHYEVVVTGARSPGSVTAAVPAGSATDAEYSTNTASTSAPGTYRQAHLRRSPHPAGFRCRRGSCLYG